MAVKLICGCLLAVALLGCLADAHYQYPSKTQQLSKPQLPPQLFRPQVDQQLSKPQLPPQLFRPQVDQQLPKPHLPPPLFRPQVDQQLSKPQLPPQLFRPQVDEQLSKPHLPPPLFRPQVDQQLSKPHLPPPLFRPQVDQQLSKPHLPPPLFRPQVDQQLSKQQAAHQLSKQQVAKTTPETFHTCEVPDFHKIPCGPPTIGAADCAAIDCCYNGQLCYYGKSVTLQCTKDARMIVVVARDATLPNLDLESVSFLEKNPLCDPVGTNSAFAIYQFPLTECGTVMSEEPGVIIYENRMASSYDVFLGPLGAITRDSSYELLVQCRYIGTSIEAMVVEVGPLPSPRPVAALGPLRVELRLANGQCNTKGCVEDEVVYNSFYVDADYPVTKVLRDPVYVEVRMLERTDPNIALALGKCWATSDPYPHSVPQWDLLIDGCPYRDDHYLTHLVPVGASSGLLYPTHHSRFVFKMFTFLTAPPANPGGKGGKGGKLSEPDVKNPPQREKVYIHCDVTVCQTSLGNDCQPRCFRKRRDIAASSKKDLRSETTLVSSQMIVITHE